MFLGAEHISFGRKEGVTYQGTALINPSVLKPNPVYARVLVAVQTFSCSSSGAQPVLGCVGDHTRAGRH
jgi:hypothetical protein